MTTVVLKRVMWQDVVCLLAIAPLVAKPEKAKCTLAMQCVFHLLVSE